MLELTSYHALAKNMIDDLVKHGYGQIVIDAVTIKGNEKTRLEIRFGKSYLFIIERENKLDNLYWQDNKIIYIYIKT